LHGALAVKCVTNKDEVLVRVQAEIFILLVIVQVLVGRRIAVKAYFRRGGRKLLAFIFLLRWLILERLGTC